jgi:purine-nucleoside phosphorylase
MNFHLAAKPGEVAETVFISGDPLRIRHMANMLLTDVFCFNEIRGALGYTGNYQGKRVSMLGTGIGIPTTALYINELATNYTVKNIIRVGTMGGMKPDLDIGDIVLAMSASTDSNTNNITFGGLNYAPTASFDLLEKAVSACRKNGFSHHVGQVFSTDSFYSDMPNRWDKWIEHGILGVEMETSVLYTMAAKFGIKALSILSVSDNLVNQTSALPEVREKQFVEMFEVALELA